MTGEETVVFIILIFFGAALFYSIYAMFATMKSSRLKFLQLQREAMEDFRKRQEYIDAHRHCVPCPYKRR